MIKHYCDRCGKEIPKNGQKTYVRVRDQREEVPKGVKVEYEICMDCLCALVDFSEGAEDEAD